MGWSKAALISSFVIFGLSWPGIAQTVVFHLFGRPISQLVSPYQGRCGSEMLTSSSFMAIPVSLL
jgi:hypothetical protein